jgi:hypothetical protein
MSLISDNFILPDIVEGMRYMMTKGELGKPILIQGAIDGAYTIREAAQRLLWRQKRRKLSEAFKTKGKSTIGGIEQGTNIIKT